MRNRIVSGGGIDRLIDDFISTVSSIPFCWYHFVRTILSDYHLVRLPFCPLPICPRTGHQSGFKGTIWHHQSVW